MNRNRIIIGQIAAILAAALLLTGGGGCARPAPGIGPAPAMTDLSNLDQLKQAFERDRGKVRLVSLLSPV